MKRFTQSMRLERLSMEQGTMDEPSAQSEQADEPEKKRLTTKVQSMHHHSLPSEKHVLNREAVNLTKSGFVHSSS